MRKTTIILFLTLSVAGPLAGQSRNTLPSQDMAQGQAETEGNPSLSSEGTLAPFNKQQEKLTLEKGGDTLQEEQRDKGLADVKDSLGGTNGVNASLENDANSEMMENQNGEPSVMPSNSYTQQESGDSNLVGWMAMVLSIATLVYLILFNRKATAVQAQNKVRGGAGVSREEYNSLNLHINALRNDLQNLSQRVEAINYALSNQQMRQYQQQTQQQPQSDFSRNNVPPRKSTFTLYASLVRDGEFIASGIKEQRTEEAAFIITVSDNEGTYVVNDDPQIQARLLASVKYSLGNAADVETKSSPARQIVTVKPGKVRRNGDGWRIVNRAYVELR